MIKRISFIVYYNNTSNIYLNATTFLVATQIKQSFIIFFSFTNTGNGSASLKKELGDAVNISSIKSRIGVLNCSNNVASLERILINMAKNHI